MGKIAIVTKLGHNDTGVLTGALSSYERTAVLNIFSNRPASEKINISHLIMELKRRKIRPTEIAMDLLVIACSLYTADTRINRDQFSDDSWTREVSLYIPVSDPQHWNQQKAKLQEIFGFLTGDLWDIYFRPRTQMDVLSPVSRISRFGMSYTTNTVCLFSGGMDSFIGAIDLISNGVQPLLLGHAKSADVSPNQKFCLSALQREFSSVSIDKVYAFLRVPAEENMLGSTEKTERGRSFLFLTLGSIVASSLSNNSRLIVPENGLISLNIPITPMRIGSHSTRTTHPYYISLMQELFNSLQLGVTIENPYQSKTKGEMLSECANPELVRSTQTMSCSHPAGRRGEGTKHCGYCVPCLIRRAAFKKAGLIEQQSYKVDILTSGVLNTNIKKNNILAFKYLIEKCRLNPNYLTALIRSTGPLGENVDPYIDIYTRGLEEVNNLISGIRL